MHECVGALCDCVGKGRKRGVLDIRRRVFDDEERHERVTQFGLTGAFRTEQIEDGEGLGLCRDNVAEQSSQQERQTDFGIVAKDVNQLFGVLAKRHFAQPVMDEAAFELVERFLLLVDG